MRIVNQDVAATGSRLPTGGPSVVPGHACVLTWDDYADCDGGIAPGCGRDAIGALRKSPTTQGAIVESVWGPWPVCPRHRLGTHAGVHDGAAVWWCKGNGGHVAAAVGCWGR